jgi:excisionase family DNA binding protein
MKNKRVMSTTELANILGISRIAIFKKIKKGQIKAVKVGRSYAISPKDVPYLSGETSKEKKHIIEQAVKKTVSEYGEVLRLLGRE